jgi:hypothetical protein
MLFGEDAKLGHYASQLKMQEMYTGKMKVCSNTGYYQIHLIEQEPS